MKRLKTMLFSAPLPRALSEVGLVALALSLLSAAGNLYDSLAALIGMGLIGFVAAALLALRLQIPHGTNRKQIKAELVCAVVFALLLAFVNAALGLVLVWQQGRSLFSFDWLVTLIVVVIFGMALPTFHAFSYLGLRASVYFAGRWNRLRQHRLLWALTHDQLLVVLTLMLLIGGATALVSLILDVARYTSFSAGITSDVVQTLVQLSVLGAFYLALTAVTLIGALPIALLLSYLLVRRIVRRVELLTEATDSLRHGDYAVRVAVQGQDEIARLQSNFNSMATDLDRTLQALQIERDRVSGLLDAQRELVASVSHELRTPVATQRAYLEAIERQSVPALVRNDLSVLKQENERLQGLIEDLFTLSRAEVGRLTLHCAPLDLGAIVERIMSTQVPLAWQRGRVALRTEAPPDLPLAVADAGRFEQVLHNLLHNAIRHTPPGGIVVVVLAATETAVQMDVNDTGTGIAPQDLPHVWERFYRANGATGDHGGAGLGLALVKELVEAMGGSVAVESTLGEGSSFRVLLPQASPKHVRLQTEANVPVAA